MCVIYGVCVGIDPCVCDYMQLFLFLLFWGFSPAWVIYTHTRLLFLGTETAWCLMHLCVCVCLTERCGVFLTVVKSMLMKHLAEVQAKLKALNKRGTTHLHPTWPSGSPVFKWQPKPTPYWSI